MREISSDIQSGRLALADVREDPVATFYAVTGNNDLYWRCEAPARALGANQALIPEDKAELFFSYPHDRGPMRWWMDFRFGDNHNVAKWKKEYVNLCKKRTVFNEVGTVFPDHRGIAIWIKPDLAAATLARRMSEEHGIRIISEVDDNYLSNPLLNLQLRTVGWGKREQNDHMMALFSMDAVVFSTRELRDVYHWDMQRRFRDLKRQGWKPPDLHVCRNNVDSEDWPSRVERQGPIRVGWMGSPSHIWDVDLAWSAMMLAKQNGAETWMIGYNPVEDQEEQMKRSHLFFDYKKHPRSVYKVNQWRKVGFRHIPWRKPNKYERLALPLDIGLCPIRTDKHTLGKSDVKALEYGISGAAVIAQNNSVYNRTLRHMETALLVGGPGEMAGAVDLLMKNEKLRQELAGNLQQYIREERNGKVMKHEWKTAVAA